MLFFGGGRGVGARPASRAGSTTTARSTALGDLDGRGVKVAPDVEGPPIDVEADAIASSAPEHLASRAPTCRSGSRRSRDAPLIGARVCQYEITPDTRFVIAPHPEHPSVWLMGGGSGHGFKHGPALAERMSAWLTGADAPEPRFALGERSSDTALRTAGEAW